MSHRGSLETGIWSMDLSHRMQSGIYGAGFKIVDGAKVAKFFTYFQVISQMSE